MRTTLVISRCRRWDGVPAPGRQLRHIWKQIAKGYRLAAAVSFAYSDFSSREISAARGRAVTLVGEMSKEALEGPSINGYRHAMAEVQIGLRHCSQTVRAHARRARKITRNPSGTAARNEQFPRRSRCVAGRTPAGAPACGPG